MVLSSWSFITEYQRHIDDFRELYLITYRVAEQALAGPPDASACSELLVTALLSTQLFTKILSKKLHLPPTLYEPMATRMARHIVQRNHVEVIPVRREN